MSGAKPIAIKDEVESTDINIVSDKNNVDDDDDDESLGTWMNARAAESEVPAPDNVVLAPPPPPPPPPQQQPQQQQQPQPQPRSVDVERQSNGNSACRATERGFAPWVRDNVSLMIVKHKNEKSRVAFNRAVKRDFRALDDDTKRAYTRLVSREQRPASRNRANSQQLCK
jgi:hypothetical protein